MTADNPAPCPALSLPFDPRDPLSLRVRPATFARMMRVSKQTVSMWIKRGTITLGADGLLEPERAARQAIANTNPAKLRARVLRQAVTDHDALRARVRALEAELARERAQREAAISAAVFRERDAGARAITRCCDALAARWDEGTTAHARGRITAWLEVLAGVEYFGIDPAELAADCAADGDDGRELAEFAASYARRGPAAAPAADGDEPA